MATATLNVRLPEELKERGMQVLNREGISVSEIVRELFLYMEQNQKVPALLKEQSQSIQNETERRKDALRSLIGILPSDDVDTFRHERLMKKSEPGVRA